MDKHISAARDNYESHDMAKVVFYKNGGLKDFSIYCIYSMVVMKVSQKEPLPSGGRLL